ncbi:MAG: response regulator [Methyloceanibacter sp.]
MAKRLPSRRALIVDDEFLIASDLESSMRELGFNVCTVASNENDAIELAKSNRPDVVVMDVYLGGTRAGIEAARWLREVCGVPIVFVTAYCDADTLERIHTVVPAAPVLSKPVYRQTLADAVSAATQYGRDLRFSVNIDEPPWPGRQAFSSN